MNYCQLSTAESDQAVFFYRDYFAGIFGSNLAGTRSRKGEVISYALEQYQRVAKNESVMIGDRQHDIIGANENGLESIGGGYGFGSQAELTLAGATKIISEPEELIHLLN